MADFPDGSKDRSGSTSMGPPIVQQDSAVLAAGYSRTHRAIEIASIVTAVSLVCWDSWRIAGIIRMFPVGAILAVPIAWLAADFGSGVVHWAGDTWGTTRTPVLGQSLIRTFREHHVDQQAITRHDVIEINGFSCLATLPMLLGSAALGLHDSLRVFCATFLLLLAISVFLTNQLHAWAHTPSPPGLVRLLQRTGLALNPAHHAIHHAPPYDQHYCITAGWMNPVLRRLRFFRRVEGLITAVTGAVPRRDDIGEQAAEATR